MEKAQLPIFAELSLADTEDFTANKAKTFKGTSNPRELRTIYTLMMSPRKREEVDRIAGCSNAPELIAGLRRRGLNVPCRRVPAIDRDGLPIRYGVYYFTDDDRRKINTWMRKESLADTNATRVKNV